MLKFHSRSSKSYFLSCFFFAFLFIAIGCGEEAKNMKGFEEHVKYVEGKGYCVSKYDERGCNGCSLGAGDSWDWFCTKKYCLEVDQEKVNLCTLYLSKEEFEKKYNLKF